MSFSKAKKAFKENGQRYLSSKDGAAWNTNAGLLNLCEALESEIGGLHSSILDLQQRMQVLARAVRQ